MSERHSRAKARHMLSKAGYKTGGHFKADEREDKRMIGNAIHEHDAQLHPGRHTKLKLKEGGEVAGAKFGARTHKPRGHKPKVKVNIMVGQPAKQPVPVPVPVPPHPAMPMPPAVGPNPGGPMPGMAKKGGRYAKGGAVKETHRYPIKSTSGQVEGKLKRGGKAKKYEFGGPVMPQGPGIGGLGNSIPTAANPNNIMHISPGGPTAGGGFVNPNHILAGPGAASGGPGNIMRADPIPSGPESTTGGTVMQAPSPFAPPTTRPPTFDIHNLSRFNEGLYKKGGRAKTKHVISDGAGGGLGRLEKAKAYGAKT